jgi:hypothetical protein
MRTAGLLHSQGLLEQKLPDREIDLVVNPARLVGLFSFFARGHAGSARIAATREDGNCRRAERPLVRATRTATCHPPVVCSGESCGMEAYRGPYTKKGVLLVATHAFLCFLLFALIATVYGDPGVAFLVMLSVVFLSTLIVRRRLWGPN